MNDFSMLDEIEKYLLEIFGDKINALENKQRFYEKVLKKSDQLEGGRKNIFLKMFLKKMFDFKNIIDNELYKKEFMEFSKRYSITRIEFENIFESAKIENEKEYYDSPAIKKLKINFSKEIQKAKVVFYYQIQFLHHHLQHNHFYFLLVEMHLLMHLLFQIHNYHL